VVSGKYIGYALVLIAFAIPLALADPAIVTLQGKLTTSSDAAITTASFRVNITNDSSPAAANALWGPFTFNNTVDSEGVFNIPLGAVNPLDLELGTVYRIVLEVDDGATQFGSPDVAFGDASPATDLMKFVNGQPDGRPRLKGLTAVNYSGNMGGISGANERCQREFPGSHICTTSDITKTGIRNGNVSWIYTEADEQKNCESFTINASLTSAQIESSVILTQYADIAYANGTFPMIVYKDGTDNDLVYVACNTENCSSSTRTVLLANGDVGGYASIATGNDSLARIAFQEKGNDLGFIRCLNHACTNRGTFNISTANIGAWLDLAIAPDGTARIASTEGGGGGTDTLYHTQCVTENCSGTSTVNTVDSSGQNRYMSITTGTDGFARIAYSDDETTDSLEYARCLNAACSSVTTKVLIGHGIGGGTDSDIAIGDDGFPRISYSIDNNLLYVSCHDHDCTSFTKTTFETTDADGQYNEIAIGSDGLARMVHYESTDRDIIFVRCLNDGCTSRSSFALGGNSELDFLALALDRNDVPGIVYNSTGVGFPVFARGMPSTGTIITNQGKITPGICSAELPIACCT